MLLFSGSPILFLLQTERSRMCPLVPINYYNSDSESRGGGSDQFLKIYGPPEMLCFFLSLTAPAALSVKALSCFRSVLNAAVSHIMFQNRNSSWHLWTFIDQTVGMEYFFHVHLSSFLRLNQYRLYTCTIKMQFLKIQTILTIKGACFRLE